MADNFYPNGKRLEEQDCEVCPNFELFSKIKIYVPQLSEFWVKKQSSKKQNTVDISHIVPILSRETSSRRKEGRGPKSHETKLWIMKVPSALQGAFSLESDYCIANIC